MDWKNQKIPPKRLLLYLLVMGWLPLLGAVWHLLQTQKSARLETVYLEGLYTDMLSLWRKQAENVNLVNRFSNSDPHWIDRELETLRFLNAEQTLLTELSCKESWHDAEWLQERLQFLTLRNRLEFKEGPPDVFAHYKEVQETLLHPVEVDGRDIETLLHRIEGADFGLSESGGANRPQLLITDFKLERKRSKQEAFSLDLKLLKRDF